MLGDGEAVADAVPMFRKETPQAERNDAMPARERPQHRRPGPKITQRTVHADEMRTLTHLDIGHVITVDAQMLHGTLLGRTARATRAADRSVDLKIVRLVSNGARHHKLDFLRHGSLARSKGKYVSRAVKALCIPVSVPIRKFVSLGNNRHCERSEPRRTPGQSACCETHSGLLRRPPGASQ